MQQVICTNNTKKTEKEKKEVQTSKYIPRKRNEKGEIYALLCFRDVNQEMVFVVW